MDTDPNYEELGVALAAAEWGKALHGVNAAEAWLRKARPGDPRIDPIVAKLVSLAVHSKWEVRRAVANAAAQALHPAFEQALARLATDDNTRVRQAAEQASLRRRDWQNASTLGKQHEDRINSTLDDIEARFGVRGRDAVKRASEQIANTFARELHHEVIKLISPLTLSADKLRTHLADEKVARSSLIKEVTNIETRVAHLRAVLDAMRSYTAQPKLLFAPETLKEVVEEAISLVLESRSAAHLPPFEVTVDPNANLELVRPRFVQALVNVLINAVEAYEGLSVLAPITVGGRAENGCIEVSVADAGCGMSEEVLADAKVLFATSKTHGTGFGLPLAVKIIESEHGGRLSMESVKGRGTIVQILIPMQRPREQG